MTRVRLAIATCKSLPTWESDDEPFHAAFSNRGVEFASCVWDDTSVCWEDFDAVLLRTTWDYCEKHAAFLDWISEVDARTRLINPGAVVRWNATKSYLADLANGGAPIAPTRWIAVGEKLSLTGVLEREGWEQAFLKPLIGATSRATVRFDRSSVAEAQAVLERLGGEEAFLVQPYLKRVETEGELSFIFFGGQFSHAVRKIPVAGDYRVQDDFGARDKLHDASENEVGLADEVRQAIERRFSARLTYARIDFLKGARGELLVNEAELIEPSLFFRHAPQAPDLFIDALLDEVAKA